VHDLASSLSWAIALTLVVALGLVVRRAPPDAERRRFALLLALAAVVVTALRLALARPTFLHANFHGGPLVDAILDYPASGFGRAATFGRFGFLVLGGIARLCGRRFEVVYVANQLFGGAALFMLAWLAYRYSGARLGALTTLAVAALHVALWRVAASEDAHTLAVLLGLVALWAVDVWAERRDRAALVAATAALILMVHTRQTLYVFVPCAYALALARGGRALWRDRAIWLSLAAVALAVALRARTTLGVESERTSFIVIALIVSTPPLVFDILRHHPLFDVVRFGPLPTLLLLGGAWSALRAGRVQRWLVISFVFCFAVSLPTAWHTPGVELAFRLPAVALGMLVCGLGGAAFARWLGARRLARPLLAAGLGLTLVWPLFAPSAPQMRQASADWLEYQFLRDAAPSLPPRLALAELPRDDARPAYSPPVALLLRSGLQAQRLSVRAQPPPPGVPRLFLAGVQCRGWSMGELLGLGDDPAKVTRAQLAEWGSAAVDGDLSRLHVPDGQRAECTRMLAHAHPVGPRGTIEAPLDDEPFVIYGAAPIPLQLYQLDDR
jgi:hypothetical protein